MTSRHLAAYLLEAAERAGDGPAFADAGGVRSYRAYRDESLRVAALLRDAGVGTGDRVCIALPKGYPLYVAIHAALLVNACYVPIDYTTPVERGRAIIDDAAARVLITTSRSRARLLGDDRETEDDIAIVVFDRAKDSPGDVPPLVAWNSPPRSQPPSAGDLDPATDAYILYTSGSTGTPKGVVQSHRSATAFADWAAAELDLGATDVLPQVASVTFDLSVFDLFATTRAGACLTPIAEGSMMSPAAFCRAVGRSRATVVYCVPSLILRDTKGQTLAWQELAQGVLRHIVFAGEPIDKPALRNLLSTVPDVPIHNWFGPTETNVCAAYRLTEADLVTDGPIPIGRPCPYARFDYAWEASTGSDLRTGELLVAGDTVLSGYWRRPEETSERIVVRDGERFYRTGDYVHFNERGDLVFIGRRDRQVKIHGRRVQLDEIEAAIRRRLPGVEVACTLLKQNGADPVIAAGVVGEPAPDVDLIRDVTSDSLPLFMMPERVVAMAALPRNERGKIDYPRLAIMLAETHP
ncbi:MAG: amino acid adenylation domain-containing protein [Bauldia sp.]|nr:amino acid adenylation domain-containing protein [Bauldia sp.]